MSRTVRPATEPPRPVGAGTGRPSPTRGVGTVAGIAVCGAAAAAAMGIGRLLPAVSPLLIAIVLGASAANLGALPGRIRPGLDFSARRLLRLGVALLGLRLMFSDVIGLGAGVIAVVVAIVVLGIAGTMYAGKLLGLSWSQRVLIACGFSICGAAAVAAAGGVLDAEEEELLSAVALVVVFGTSMIAVVPLLANVLELSGRQAGIWAGGSIHEVAQVVAAGGLLGGSALAVATLVKLARVLMLAPVLAYLGAHRRRMTSETDIDVAPPPLIPLFVLGFLGCVALRSSGLLPPDLIDAAQPVQTALLAGAMFALGTGVRVSMLRSVGPRLIVLATLSTVWVAGIALAGVLLVA